MNEDEKWMKIAIQEAIQAEKEDEVPVGAILVKDGLLIAQAHNQPITTNDATAHAEIQLIRVAGGKLKNYRLTGTSLYVTLEPCGMCLGAIMHARLERIIFGAYNKKIGTYSSATNLNNSQNLKNSIKITGGVLERKCSKLLQTFFKSRR